MNDNHADLSGSQVEHLKSEITKSQHTQESSQKHSHTPQTTGDALISSEGALRRSEALLNATQRLSKVGGWEWNVEKQTMFWTEETYRIHDFVQGELVPGTPEHIEKSLACYEPADRRAILRAFQRCAEFGEPYDFELPFTTAVGRRRWIRTTACPVYDNGQIVSVIGNIMDISEHKKDQEQLIESERRLSTLMANLPGMAYRCRNDELWTMTFVSKGCLDLTGYPSEELLENRRVSYAELIHPDDRQMVWDQVQHAIETRSQFNLTYRIRSAAGEEKWVMEIGEGVFSDEGNLVAIEGFITDITKRVRTEDDKARLEDQNRQLQKAESLGRMAGAIAHRFNNLLGVVLGNLEMVMNAIPSESLVVDSLIDAIQSARKAAEVSRLMLTYLGQSRGKLDPLDLSETCRRCLKTFQSTLPKDVILMSEFLADGPVIRANANQIQQVLTNVCTNAWEAIGGRRGTIQLIVKVVSPEEIPTVNRFPLDWQPQAVSYACIEVADSGCGIASKDIDKLFDPFFSSKFAGRGLGLPVVLGMVKSCEGGVVVESRPGKGSTFRIYFPVSDDEVSPQLDHAAEVHIPEGEGTILLVEDDDMLRKLTMTVLKSLGFDVVSARDGAEALETFRQHQEKIQFVLCDLTMPRMDGWQTLEALRKLSPEIKVILTSGYNEAQAMAGEHRALPDAFLGKPYERDELIQAIGQVLAKKR
ncbi:MAG: PAS domain-containing sensor histidine kinase [Deltaproteobacteria bacterium]|nr:MAG: PAS domain-containing sensor histidine kinase [Deltaproteobacteria bacterium]